MITQYGQVIAAGALLLRRLGFGCANHSTEVRLACFHAGRTACWPEVVVPPLGESVSEGTISTLLKKVGDNVAIDEPVAQLETDKVTIDCKSQHAGTMTELKVKLGDTVKPGDIIGVVGDQAAKPAPSKAEKADKPAASAAAKDKQTSSSHSGPAAAAAHHDDHGRVPMIKFPTRILPNGRRVSDLMEAESDKLTAAGAQVTQAPAAAVQTTVQKTDEQQAPKPQVSGPKTTTQQAKQPPTAPRPPASPNTEYLEELPSRGALTQREIDLINSGGAL